MKGYGYKIIDNGNEVIITNRPRQSHWGYCFLLIALLPLMIMSAVYTGRVEAYLAIAANLLGILYFIRIIYIRSSESLTIRNKIELEWIQVPGIKAKKNKTIFDQIPMDIDGYRFLIKKYLPRALGPSSESAYWTPSGRIGYLDIYVSKGAGLGYERILTLYTLEKELPKLSEAVQEKLPKSRIK